MSLILEGLKEPAKVQLKMTNQVENTTLVFFLQETFQVFSALTLSVKFYYLSIIMKTWLFIVINTNIFILKNRFWLQQDSLVRKKRHSYKRKKTIFNSQFKMPLWKEQRQNFCNQAQFTLLNHISSPSSIKLQYVQSHKHKSPLTEYQHYTSAYILGSKLKLLLFFSLLFKWAMPYISFTWTYRSETMTRSVISIPHEDEFKF